MKKILVGCYLFVGLFSSNAWATPIEYVKICSLYGSGWHYLPGTDICIHATQGEARQQTEGGTWRTRWPYPEGTWVRNPNRECAGKLVKVGEFQSTHFTLNDWGKKETPPFTLVLQPDRFISKIFMWGGFHDPRLSFRTGTGISSGGGFCLRSKDPTVLEDIGSGPQVIPWGLGQLPLGCIANGRVVGMPAAYAITAQGAYPQVDNYFLNAEQTNEQGPFVWGRQLVVTTDITSSGENQLTYFDASDTTNKPLAGTLHVAVCVEQ